VAAADRSSDKIRDVKEGKGDGRPKHHNSERLPQPKPHAGAVGAAEVVHFAQQASILFSPLKQDS
jgi:hypothetical protein